MKEKSSSAPWVNCACGVITIYFLSVLNVVCLLVIFVSWMLIKRSKSDIFWEQKEQTRRDADRTNKTEKNANIFLTDSICFYLFCLKDFWSRPLQMQHFFSLLVFFRVWKRRLLMYLLSFIELSCIRTLNGHHTHHHSMFYDIFVLKEKKNLCKRIYALNIWFLMWSPTDLLEWKYCELINFWHCFILCHFYLRDLFFHENFVLFTSDSI